MKDEDAAKKIIKSCNSIKLLSQCSEQLNKMAANISFMNYGIKVKRRKTLGGLLIVYIVRCKILLRYDITKQFKT